MSHRSGSRTPMQFVQPAAARLSHPAGEIQLHQIKRGVALEIAACKTLTRPVHNNKERIYLFDKLYYTQSTLEFVCVRVYNHYAFCQARWGGIFIRIAASFLEKGADAELLSLL